MDLALSFDVLEELAWCDPDLIFLDEIDDVVMLADFYDHPCSL